MTNQHVKGAVSTIKGVVDKAVGKLKGDKTLETKGRAEQVQGVAQRGLGDVEDTVHKVRDHHA